MYCTIDYITHYTILISYFTNIVLDRIVLYYIMLYSTIILYFTFTSYHPKFNHIISYHII